jgi:hypothetical protein
LYRSPFGLIDRISQQILQPIDFRVYGVRGETHWHPPPSRETQAIARHNYGLPIPGLCGLRVKQEAETKSVQNCSRGTQGNAWLQLERAYLKLRLFLRV